MTSIADRGRNRDRFIKSVKVKLTDEAYSQLEKRYNKDSNEVETFLNELKLHYSSKDRTLEGPLCVLKEAMSKVMEELNKNENKMEKSRNKEVTKDGHAQIHGDVDDEDDKATAPKKELMSRKDEQINMEVDHKDDENAVAKKEVTNKSGEMVTGKDDDDDDDHNDEKVKVPQKKLTGQEKKDGDNDDDDDHNNEKVKVPQKKLSEQEKKDGDDDDDDDDNDEIHENENLKGHTSVGHLAKLSASGETGELEKSKFPIQSGSGDSRYSQKFDNKHSEEQEKHQSGDEKKDGYVSQSDTQSQAFDKTSHSLDQPSTQRENSENFPNNGNEQEGFERHQSIQEIKTFKSQASDKISSFVDLLNQEHYSISGTSYSSLNTTGRHQRDIEVNVLLGIKNQPEADNDSSMQNQKKSDSSTNSDFEKIEGPDGIETGQTTSDDSSEESVSKNNVGGTAKETHSAPKISNSKKISKKTLILKHDEKANPAPNKDEIHKKINQHTENQSGEIDFKDVANNSGLAGVHQGHSRRVRNNPISERINLSSGSSTGNKKISARDLSNDSDEAEKGWQASTSERRMGQSQKSAEDTSNGSSYAQGNSSENRRHRSQSESKCKIEANSRPHVSVLESDTFPIPNVDCDLDTLKDIITAENKLGHIKIELSQDKEDLMCTISGGNNEEMRKTKQWLLDFIDTNIQDNDASSRNGIKFVQDKKSTFEENLCLQQNVLHFAVKCGEGCFIALRWFLEKLRGSYSRLHFDLRTKEIIIVFSDSRDKLDAEQKKLICENDIKMSAHHLTDKISKNIIAKVSHRMPDVFVEFNDDKKYFIIGDNEKFVDECLTMSKNKKISFFPRNTSTPKFVSLKVEIANKELSKVNADRFVIFSDVDKDISLVNFGFRDCTRDSSIEKLSQCVELVNTQYSRKNIYLVRTPTHSDHHGREEMLRDLYSIALYHASDGAASLAMTLTKTEECGLDASVAILHEVIKDYDLGKRVHDKLKTLTIVSKDQNHYKKLKGYFN